MTRKREFEQLAQRYLDGQATATDIARLNERLRADAAARQWLIELLDLDSALAAVAAERAPELADREEPSVVNWNRRHRRRLAVPVRWMLAAAACLAIIASGALWRQSTQRAFATVHSGAGVDELADGTSLRGEIYEIKAGMVELVTARRAKVVIEAPAKFRFESAQRLHLSYGRAAAEAPPAAKGFTIVTPAGEAVDLGTKFGVDAPLEGESEIHVFEGEVVAQAADGGARRSLHDGEAVMLQAGAGASRALRSSAFIRPAEVASLHAALVAGQRERSDAALARLRRDPALIVLLDFESDELPEGDYRLVQGRWPGSHAPEFVEVGDHMTLDVGGDREWPQLTLAAWVRLDRLGEPYQSLLHTDGWNQNHFGQVHWMVTRHTTMRLALFGNTLAPGSDEQEGFPDSRTSVLAEQGRWMHLATVYDSEKRTVRFYLNGAFDKETRQEVAYPARLGPAQVGNWDQQDRKLSGRVDELLLLRRVLNDDEVRDLHAAGNPYR